MTAFTVYWKYGKRQVMEGPEGCNIADAFMLAGYGQGAVRAVDFYAKGDDTQYDWDPKEERWVKNRPIFNHV